MSEETAMMRLPRFYRAAQVFGIPDDPRYAGCRSRIDVEQHCRPTAQPPVLDDEAFRDMLRTFDNAQNPTALAQVGYSLDGPFPQSQNAIGEELLLKVDQSCEMNSYLCSPASLGWRFIWRFRERHAKL